MDWDLGESWKFATVMELELWLVLFTEFTSAWYGLANCAEQYCLRYESKYLQRLGQALEYVVRIGLTAAVKQTLVHTALGGMYLFVLHLL